MTEQAQRCPSCGTSEWQWREDPDAYEAVLNVCPGCQRKDWLREDQGDAKTQAGSSIGLLPRARAEFLRNNPIKRPRRRRRKKD
jgi:hypothetical protein